jgi:hypothetical protein
MPDAGVPIHCKLFPNSNRTHTTLFANWVNSATCAWVPSYRRLADNADICFDCFHTKTKQEQLNYSFGVKHYIRLGARTGLEECEECFVLLVVERDTEECGDCDEILADFLRFVVSENDRPYDDPSPTIIAISNRQLPSPSQ